MTVYVNHYDRSPDTHVGGIYHVDDDGSLQVSGVGYRATYPRGAWFSVRCEVDAAPAAPAEPLKVGDKVNPTCKPTRVAEIVSIDGDFAWIKYAPERQGVARLSTLTRA